MYIEDIVVDSYEKKRFGDEKLVTVCHWQNRSFLSSKFPFWTEVLSSNECVMKFERHGKTLSWTNRFVLEIECGILLKFLFNFETSLNSLLRWCYSRPNVFEMEIFTIWGGIRIHKTSLSNGILNEKLYSWHWNRFFLLKFLFKSSANNIWIKARILRTSLQ